MKKGKRKLVIFTPYNPYPPKGGGTIRVWKLVEGISKRGWNVTLICYGNFEKELKIDGVLIKQIRFPLTYRAKTIFLNLLVKKFGQKRFLVKINNMRVELMDKRVKNLVMKINPDIIQCESIWFCKSSLNAAEKLCKPLVLTEHNIESKLMESFGLNSGFFMKIEKEVLRRSTYIICVSEDDEKTLRDWGIRHVRTISSGFELKLKRRIDIRRKYGLPSDSFIGVFVGSMWLPNIEAVKYLCEMARELNEKNIFFMVVGRVSKAFIGKKIPKNVIFTGFVSDNELANIYSQCNIGILPLTSGGGAKQKTIDMINAKVPFIATSKAIEGLTEFFRLKHLENCIIEDNISKFPYWILKLRNEKKLSKKLKGGLQHSVQQTWDQMVEEYARIYKRMLGE